MNISSQPPTHMELKRARDEFANLLSVRTKESIWQKFFTENPYVLSRSLPIKLLPCDIIPLGRPGKSEPDFIIHPGPNNSLKLHGIIEIKTPHSRVIRQPRRNVLSLSSDAQTAIRQVLKYDQCYDNYAPSRRTISFQSASHLFVIIGRTDKIMTIEEELLSDFRSLFPPGIRFLGFDELFHNFNEGLPRNIIVLQPKPMELLIPDIDKFFSNTKEQHLILHRLVQQKFPSINLYDEMNEEEKILIRSLNELNPPRSKQKLHPHVFACFNYGSPFDRRFCPAGVGAFYGSDSLECAIDEHLFHRGDFLESFPMNLVMQHHTYRFRGRLARLSDSLSTDLALDKSSYDFSVQVAKYAIDKGVHGILYPSNKNFGQMGVIYRPEGIEYLENRGSIVIS